LWYLSVVLAYYALFGVMLSRPMKDLFVFSVVVFFICLILNLKYGLFDPRFFEFYFIFIAGLFFSRNAIGKKIIDSPLWLQILLLLGSGVFYWFYCLKDYQIVTFSYLTISFLFGLSSIVLALRLFRRKIFHWKIWLPISYASFFAYLFHRPIWEIMFTVTPFPWNIHAGWYRFIPGSILVLVICYYMQFGYDMLLRASAGIWNRLALRSAS
jgi:hypothetical protein